MQLALLKSKQFQSVFDDYSTLIKFKGYKTGNGKMYPVAVKEFLLFQEKNGHNQLQFGREQMTAYYQYLTHRKSRRGDRLAFNTVNHHLFAIALFFEMLLKMDLVESTPYLPKFLRGKQAFGSILEQDEMQEVYRLCVNEKETAMLSVAYGCGLRRTEIEQLDVYDFNPVSSTLIIRKGKNAKRREIPLSRKVVRDMSSYLLEQRHRELQVEGCNEPSFFINRLGKRMTGSSHYRLFSNILQRSNCTALLAKNLSLHSLRRSIASHLAENGADIYFIQSFLGHSEIDTSQLYIIRKRKNRGL